MKKLPDDWEEKFARPNKDGLTPADQLLLVGPARRVYSELISQRMLRQIFLDDLAVLDKHIAELEEEFRRLYGPDPTG